MFGSKIRLEKELLERCRHHAREVGYSSVEEFITHALEKELRTSTANSDTDREKLAGRLKGLGYID